MVWSEGEKNHPGALLLAKSILSFSLRIKFRKKCERNITNFLLVLFTILHKVIITTYAWLCLSNPIRGQKFFWYAVQGGHKTFLTLANKAYEKNKIRNTTFLPDRLSFVFLPEPM